MKCRYMPRKDWKYPCNECKNKDKTKCSVFGGHEPLTCEHCRYYCGIDKIVCYKRKGYNIRPCEEFMWD